MLWFARIHLPDHHTVAPRYRPDHYRAVIETFVALAGVGPHQQSKRHRALLLPARSLSIRGRDNSGRHSQSVANEEPPAEHDDRVVIFREEQVFDGNHGSERAAV